MFIKRKMMYLGYNFNAVIPNKNILSTTDQESLSFERMERAKDFLIAVKQFIGKELDFFKAPSQLKSETVAISILENYTGKSGYPRKEEKQAWHSDYGANGIFTHLFCFEIFTAFIFLFIDF